MKPIGGLECIAKVRSLVAKARPRFALGAIARLAAALAQARIRVAIGLMALISAAAWSQIDPGQAGREAGARGNQAATQAPNADPSTYPGFAGAHPPQAGYYGSSPSGMTGAARAAGGMSTSGRLLGSRAATAPRFFIAPGDPLLQRQRDATITGSAVALGGGSACGTIAGRSGTGGDGQSQMLTCQARAFDRAPACVSTLETTCPPPDQCTSVDLPIDIVQTDATVAYAAPTLTIGEIRGHGDCATIDADVAFTVPNPSALKALELSGVTYDDWMLVAFNGKTLHTGPFAGDRLEVRQGEIVYDLAGHSAPCERAGGRTDAPAIDLRGRLVEGVNHLHVRLAGGGDYFNGTLTLRTEGFCDCAGGDRWSQACQGDSSGPSCRAISKTCTSGRQTRDVGGVPLTRDCWEWTEQWICDDPLAGEDAACHDLRARGCVQSGSDCVETGADGRCATFLQTFRCDPVPAARDVTLCASDLYCPHGDCVADIPVRTPSTPEQMAHASTWLRQAQNAASDLDGSTGTFAFFRGDARECDQAPAGFSNCCSASGWGLDAGLAQCSAHERELGLAREAHRAHYVGSYTSGSILETRHEAYCVFTSLLSRLIQEQGRTQLGVGWGSARSPDCRALTPGEMARLDFDAMDFAEFHAQAQASAEAAMAGRPTGADLVRRLQSQIGASGSTGTGGSDAPPGP